MEVFLFLCSFLILSSLVRTECPHENIKEKLSDLVEDFDKSTVVKITSKILLDVEELNVDKIIIEDSGRLVFNRGHSITIKTKGILVKDNAALVIGSQDCPHKDPVNIYLEGSRTENRKDLGPEGDKFIMVTDNGSLQIFGQDKIAWTKLTATVDRFDKYGSNIIYRHLDSDQAEYQADREGITMTVFNSDLERTHYEVYDPHQGKIKYADKHIQSFMDALDAVNEGDIVALSVMNDYRYNEGCIIEQLFEKLENITGMEENGIKLRNANMYDSWALVFVKGGAYAQDYRPLIGTALTRSEASIDYGDYRISAVSQVKYYKKLYCYVDVLILDTTVGYPTITVLDDVSSWNVGDEVLLTSTDYAWNHSEVRRIKEKVGPNTLKLDGPLYYRHFGEIESGVDMRGEVALLTRNIKIQGVMEKKCPSAYGWRFCYLGYDVYGGHLKIHESFNSVHIEGAEFQFMGQTTDRGFYPIHFHMCKNITGQTAIVRRNSIHHTFRRAVTVHGTWGASETQLGVQVIENVAYDILGHAYFLEDGVEVATLFKGNLVADVKNVKNDFITDFSRVTGFWITNPKVIMVDNVAAGSESFGIWYTFPREPIGLCKGLVFDRLEAKHTKLWRFDNNVVHSNTRTLNFIKEHGISLSKVSGMFFDFILDNDDGKVAGCMEYEPRENPLDPHSKPAKSQLTRLTAYKNRDVNTWLRGGYFEMMQYSSAESRRGMQLAKGSSQQMFVRKSVFVGRSVGNSESEGYPNAETPEIMHQYIGAVLHDGPTYYESCWFTGFEPGTNGSFVAGAIGFSVINKFTSSVVSTLKDLRFGFEDKTEGNRVFDGDVDTSVHGDAKFDCAETATFRDADGSITSCPATETIVQGPPGATSTGAYQWSYPTQLVVPEKYALTERCVYRDNWKLAVCNDKYGKIKISAWDTFNGTPKENFDKAGQMRRFDLTNPGDIAVESRIKQKTTEYMAILGRPEYYYEFQFTNDYPKQFRVEGNGVERGMDILVGVCLPNNATYGVDYFLASRDIARYFSMRQIRFVDTLEELIADNTLRKFYQKDRMLYMKVTTNKAREEDWDRHDTDHCPSGYCPRINIYMDREMPYEPCFEVTEDQMSNTEIMEKITQHDCALTATSPNSDWGTGDTRTESRDAQWGEWSGWAECCYNEGETKQITRYRLCDNPPSYGDGADCDGVSEETTDCTTPCPVDGILGQWSDWSDCFCDGVAANSYGARTRTRPCDGPYNGGKACGGPILDRGSCVGDCGYFPDNS